MITFSWGKKCLLLWVLGIETRNTKIIENSHFNALEIKMPPPPKKNCWSYCDHIGVILNTKYWMILEIKGFKYSPAPSHSKSARDFFMSGTCRPHNPEDARIRFFGGGGPKELCTENFGDIKMSCCRPLGRSIVECPHPHPLTHPPLRYSVSILLRLLGRQSFRYIYN